MFLNKYDNICTIFTFLMMSKEPPGQKLTKLIVSLFIPRFSKHTLCFPVPNTISFSITAVV